MNPLVWPTTPGHTYLVFDSVNGGRKVQLTPHPITVGTFQPPQLARGQHAFTVVAIDPAGRSDPSKPVFFLKHKHRG